MTNRVRRAAWTAVVIATTSGALGGCEGEKPQNSSATHFLDDCVTTCAGGLTCLCGVCTKACTRDSECSMLAAVATCTPPAGGASCSSSAPPQICDVTCSGDQDCATLTTAPWCSGGRCRATPGGDAGSGDGGGLDGSGGRGATDAGPRSDARNETPTDASPEAGNDTGVTDGGGPLGNYCVAPPVGNCFDGAPNGDETDRDCGGSCTPCTPPSHCDKDADCTTARCRAHTCETVPATCTNSTVDPGETALDCGGPDCGACGTGLGCKNATDCLGGYCVASKCASAEELVVSVLGEGTVTSAAAGIDCGDTCSTLIAPGTSTPALTATAAPGWAFTEWSDAACGAASTCTPSSRAVHATFSKNDVPSSRLTKVFTPDSLDSSISTVTVDDAGTFTTAGSFAGTIRFDGGSVTSVDGNDIVLSHYDAAGNYVWSKRLGGLGSDAPFQLGSDHSGGLILFGRIGDVTSVGGAALSCSGGPFLARFDAATGAHVWSRCISLGQCPSCKRIYGMAVDADGNIVLGGGFTGANDFGDGSVSVPNNGLFLVKFSNAGTFQWKKTFPISGTGHGEWTVAAGHGLIGVGGRFEMGLDIGGGSMTTTNYTGDFFAGAFTSNGDYVWSNQYSGNGDVIIGVAIDSSGAMVLAGDFYTSFLDIGCGRLTTAGQSAFIARLNANTGGTYWTRRLGPEGPTSVTGLGVGPDGTISIVGTAAGRNDFGDGDVQLSTLQNFFLASYDTAGRVRTRLVAGGSLKSDGSVDGSDDSAFGGSLAVDGSGRALATGYGHPKSSTTADSPSFVTRLAP